MTDTLIKKKNVIMDATVMNTVLACGRLADFKFNHHFESNNGKSNSLEVGTLVHKVLEVYNKHLLKGFKRDDAIAQGLIAGELYANGCKYCADFTSEPCGCNTPPDENCGSCKGTGYTKTKCGHQPQEYPGVKNTPEQSESYHVGWKYALETCVQYFEHYRNDPWIILESEVVKSDILYEDDEIRVLWKAKLDAVYDTNQGIYSCDYKTQKQTRKKLRLNNQFIGQCMIMKKRNIIIDNIGFQKSLKAEEKFKREMLSYSADLLLEWQSETMPHAAYKLLEWQENNYWPPNYTHCENKFGNCQFVGVCEADRNMREEEIKLHFHRGPEWNPTNDNEE